MSIITFVNNTDEQTGKTMSVAAIATHMAIEYNNRILIISTTNKDDRIKSCYFDDRNIRKLKIGIFGENRVGIDNESGIEGIVKMLKSNKLTPQIITNYSRVVFKDRLEVILGSNRPNETPEKKAEISRGYLELIEVANQYYDKVFVDLDSNINEQERAQIIAQSDLVIVNISQNLKDLQKLKENKEKNELLKLPKSLLLIGRYDKYSKYNVKNITRYLGEKNQVLVIPYNTLYFEATNEAGVPDLFLNFRKIEDVTDRNAVFVKEIKRASENIVYRLQELQHRI